MAEELRLELDILNEPAATFGYDSAERGGDHPPIGDAHLYFEIVALAERNFLVLLNLGQTPVIGATIFEFDLALLDPASWISNSAKTGLVPANVSPRRRGEDPHSTGQVLQLSL